ncbi:hypothetical protein Cfor_05946 [Coptotermes formosanus]|uniref:Uncharacterized protein n=1 Tax=Coptotermes formosanus TaxID=36987 RepID=A0A6L2Q3A7_COPFO|nr:hypothetical protein Cfor_05946 [Coptotermes formosanus]
MQAIIAQPVRVTVRQGVLKGKIMTSAKGRTFYAFQSIPYAKPPTGDLRFRAPQRPAPWVGELDATEPGPACIQFTMNSTVVGSEDCLHLNVFTTYLPKQNGRLNKQNGRLLDVMFWIHGGGFYLGSANDYPPQYLMDKNVVFVSTNYRLGVLGFLSTGDDESPGNYGLRDQTAALEWVQENIAAFGGNPNSVTIFGQSAGSMSVHYHILSRLSKGLFHRAISMSGTAFSPFVRCQDPLRMAQNQARIVNCPDSNTSTLVDCLRHTDAVTLIRTYPAVNLFYVPCVENQTARNPKPFLRAEPPALIRAGDFSKVPWIVGSTSQEVAFVVASPQLLYSVNKVDIKALICSEFYKTNSCYQILRAVIPELDGYPESGAEIKGSKTPSLRTLILMSDKQYRGAYRLIDVMASARPESLQIIRDLQTKIQADDGCAIHFSSGTTGFPKGVLLSNHNLINSAMEMGRRFGIDMKGSKLLASTLFCHTSGTLLVIVAGLCHGVTCVIPAPVFDARKMVEGLIQERCTHIFGTPSLFLDMICTSQELGLQVTTLQAAAYGGAPCSQELALQMKRTLNIKTLVPAYGMTEICVAFCAQPGDTLEQTTATVGFVLDHIEVKVVDKEGRMVPMGTPGELWVRGYGVMLGYWNDEEKTRQFLGPDGWAKTGDQFVLQEDGYGRIVGRIKDVIIRIGDKIFPTEIEDFFTGHPDILEAQAFGVPDPKVGEEVCVFLRLREGATLTEQDVRDYCKDKIVEYRIPRYIRFVKDFERTAIGKVQKFRLLEQLQRELDSKNLPWEQNDHTSYRDLNHKFINAKCKCQTKFHRPGSCNIFRNDWREIGEYERAEVDWTGLDSDRFGSVRLYSSGLDWTGLGSIRIGSTLVDWTGLDSGRFGSVRLYSSGLDWTGLGSIRIGSTLLDWTGLDLT